MKKIFHRAVAVAAAALMCAGSSIAQEPVKVGAGSYASYMPLSSGKTDSHGGDQSTLMQTRKFWVTERPGQPIPTNDWWTGLINAQFAQALWSYPAMVYPDATGVTVTYPSYWNENGSEVKWRSSVTVMSKGFTAADAVAHTWHDWDVEMLQNGTDGNSRMLTTLMHGTPFTWIETTGMESFTVKPSDAATLFDTYGEEVTATDLPDYPDSHIGMRVGDDCYGIYLPAGTSLSTKEGALNISGIKASGSHIIVALLPAEDYLADYAAYAYNIPRNTTVSWKYNERRGEISSTWAIDAVNLNTGEKDVDVLQGFIPHAYKSALKKPVFLNETYLTPRGTMKMTSGREFTFAYKFAGMMPWYAAPKTGDDADHPYDPAVVEKLLRTYAEGGAFGADTYWGGKGLVQMALNMTFAMQTGNEDIFEMSKKKLKDIFVNWLTYTPGEPDFFFAYYPRWGGLVGQATSYDSDTFNDHHFHYGYFTLAGAILCMVDPDFKAQYGEMLKLLAKDYANWDHNDTRFPFLRTMDPWAGHSYAGGLGDNGNYNGNGQESTSESMQGWGGIYLLGVALDDKEMRDAGIFGWATEARATREYWFDVDSRKPNPLFDPEGYGGNIDYTLYPYPYNSNITCKGIGWWTWFGGDPLYMHGIQWMPISPALDYLSWDPDFVQWAYDDMMESRGWVHKWFETGTNPEGGDVDPLANNDWGNVTLAYLQRANPALAASIFDEALKGGNHIATSVSTSHISYFITHHHLTYGEIDWTVNADIPTANVYVDADGNYTYMVYNPGPERDVTFYRDGVAIKTVRAPQGKLTAIDTDPAVSEIQLTALPAARFPSSATVSARVLDQYGATADDAKVAWSLSDTSVATVNGDGTVTFAADAADGATVTLTASCNSVSATMTLIKGPVPVVETMAITPATTLVEIGNAVTFDVEMTDQYDAPFTGEVAWSINGAPVETPRVDAATPGKYTVTASCGDKSTTHHLVVVPRLPNIALGKEVTASSEENAGSVRAGAVDGDSSTRWGSKHTEDEWIYVDLGEDCRITRVDITWEAAFSSQYLIQTAPDGSPTQKFTAEYFTGDHELDIIADDAWTTVSEVTGVSGPGKQTHSIDATGRYVRIKNVKRGSQYGISLYEMAVAGIPLSATDNDIVGVDITADRATVDEDATLQFHATAYTLGGGTMPVDVTWGASQGTITTGGLFTPATYGTATISATTATGFTSTRDVIVNEVIHLASLTVTPATIKMASGSSATFDISGLNQFGGQYDLSQNPSVTVTDAEGNTADGLIVNLDSKTVTATTTGSYHVTFSLKDATATLAVEVVPFADVNLALNRPATAASGANPGLSNDGDATTRWQASPGKEQWWQVELDGMYNVNRFRVVWEASFASAYHIEVSTDGETYTPVAYNAASPSGDTLTQELTTGDIEVPARYVRLVPDELSDLARQWGVSFFELEVYGTGAADTNDTDAPIITGCDTTIDGTSAAVSVTARDNSGIVFYTLQLTEQAMVDPYTVTRRFTGRSGETVTIAFDGLNGNTAYTLLLTAADACGNASATTRTFATEAKSYDGVNLAMGKPVEESSHENDGTVASNAVDGNTGSRWGSQFNDGEWMSIDLEAVYRIQQIRIFVNDAAYATKALIEYSIDGDNWETLTTVTRSAIGTWDEIPVDNKLMRYVRYTGLERSMVYGVSVHEFEVYGDAKMLSVKSTDGSNVKLEGEWDTALFADIDNAAHTTYDLTAVTGLENAKQITTLNPNCLLFATSPIPATPNVAVVSAEGVSAASVDLYEGHDFSSPCDINVTGNITFHADADSSPSRTLVLPFDFTATDGMITYMLDTVQEDAVSFYKESAIAAHQPFLIVANAPVGIITVNTSTLRATAATSSQARQRAVAAAKHSGTYTGMTLSGTEHTYNASTGTFDPAADGATLQSFNTYMQLPEARSYTLVTTDSPTGIVSIPAGVSEPVNVYTIDGILIKSRVDATEALRGLAPGFYIVGDTTVRVK